MEYSGTDQPMLIGQSGPLNGDQWEILEEILIGRDPTCEIVIPAREVSRFHARLTQDSQGVLLEDLGSKNGTYRNGERIEEPIYLLDGDMIQVALVQGFAFVSSDATMPLNLKDLPDYIQAQPAAPQGNGCLKMDMRARRVWVNEMELDPPLSGNQFRLLEQLYRNSGDVVTRTELITAVWGEDALGISEQALDALVRRLRERLAEADANHEYVVTVRGHGLRLDNPVHAD
ncbi:MAG: FHA domain-containing protein [Anaerolineaceae bacterium]|nr:FHA domain-containing protein [Anaerolineaceae bacterium]